MRRFFAAFCVLATAVGCGTAETRVSPSPDDRPVAPPVAAETVRASKRSRWPVEAYEYVRIAHRRKVEAFFAKVAENEAAARRRRPQVLRSASSAAPSGRCAIPDYICVRESRFSPTAVSPGGSWRGKYQFVQGTWNKAVAGAGFPQYVGVPADQVPEDVQDAAASYLWNGGQGCGHWNAC